MPEDQSGAVMPPIRLTMQILERLAACGGEMGVTEIAHELSATKPRVFRHLQSLLSLGYVSHSPATRKYSVGMRLNLLAKIVGDNVELTKAIKPALETLRDKTGQTSVFASLLDGRMAIVDFAVGTTFVQYAFRPGASFSLHTSSLGHVALAFGPQDYWDLLRIDDLKLETPKSITNPSRLARQVQTAKARGWTIVPEGAVAGVNAIAAPVFYHDASFAGAVAIVGSVQNIPAKPPQELIDAVVEAGRQASGSLGMRWDAAIGI